MIGVGERLTIFGGDLPKTATVTCGQCFGQSILCREFNGLVGRVIFTGDDGKLFHSSMKICECGLFQSTLDTHRRRICFRSQLDAFTEGEGGKGCP